MACEYICDGCGKRTPAAFWPAAGKWGKPDHWYQRGDDDGMQDACSRECVARIAAATGKTRCIIPI